MAETVYLHVGAPKTGTTYLQDGLWAYEPRLRTAGVLIPGGRRFAAFHAAQAIREVPWLADMPPGRRDVWDDMQQRIRAWDGVAVLSHEFLAAATREQAERAVAALAPAEVHIVLTARDYVPQLPAMWQETVKMGGRQSLRRYANRVIDGDKRGPWSRATMDSVDVLDRWSGRLPPERVHVVTVPVSRGDPGLLWRRFIGLCGMDADDFPAPPRLSNESLTAVDTELLRRVSAALPESLTPKRVRHRWVRGLLAQQVLTGRDGVRPVLDSATAARARAWAEESVVEIERRGYDVVGDVHDLVSAPLPDGSRPVVTDEQLIESAAVTIGELVERYMELEKKADSLSEQVRHLQRAAQPVREPSQSEQRRRLRRWRRGASPPSR